MKKKWKKDFLIILPVKNTVFHKFIVQLSSFYGGRIFLVFFSFLVRNSILFLVSHEKFKTEKNATCNCNAYIFKKEPEDEILYLWIDFMEPCTTATRLNFFLSNTPNIKNTAVALWLLLLCYFKLEIPYYSKSLINKSLISTVLEITTFFKMPFLD